LGRGSYKIQFSMREINFKKRKKSLRRKISQAYSVGHLMESGIDG